MVTCSRCFLELFVLAMVATGITANDTKWLASFVVTSDRGFVPKSILDRRAIPRLSGRTWPPDLTGGVQGVTIESYVRSSGA